MTARATFLALAVLATPTHGAARSPASDEQIRQELHEVFSRAEFRPGSQEPDWLRAFFQSLRDLEGRSPALFWLLLATCLGLLGLLAGYLVRSVLRSTYRGPAADAAKDAEQRRRLSARFRAEADEQAAAGDFTAAVRCLFLALVYAFDESGRLLFQPALTNREYLRGFSNRPVLQRDLGVFVDVLDANWYGQRATTPQQYADCLGLFERLRQG